MKLVIVESPTKTKSLSKYLGKGYEVLASMGHVSDLPKSKMGIEVEKKGKGYKFKPEYMLVRGKGKEVSKLKAAAKTASVIYLATDPDREGEAIAWHVQEILGTKKDKDKFKRIAFHSITKEAVLEALEKPTKVSMDMVDSQQARRVLDRLVGYKLSPVLWRKVRRGLSAGRVQSVALRLVVDRERQIEAFKADEYWIISVKAETKGKEKVILELRKIGEKNAEVKKEQTAREIEADLNSAHLKVIAVTKKERKSWPKPPFKTSTLQQAAANVLGWSSKKTMQVAQKLYEQGDITYHRTDSLNLAGGAIEKVRKFIKSEFGAEYLPEKPVYYKTNGKVVAQEAHEAIRPANMEVGTNSYESKGKYGADNVKLYGLIWRRTIACQMTSAVYDATAVDVLAQGERKYELRVNGEVIKFDGWRKLYKKGEDVAILPVIEEGEELKNNGVIAEQKFTLPPARFNDASLVKELEKRGIGRPSTYASIISTILSRNYVNRENRRFFATKVGMTVSDFLVKNFPLETEYDFTAKMEDGLDDIARGELDWQKYLSDFYGPFEKTVEKVIEKAERVAVPVEKTGQKCPECKKGEVVVREGRFGEFLSCDQFPECKYTANYKQYVEGAKCEECGKKVVMKRTRRGREFYGCDDYPNCEWATWTRPGSEKDAEKKEEKKQDDEE